MSESMRDYLSDTFARKPHRPTPVRWQMVSESGRVSRSPVHRLESEGTTACGELVPSGAWRPTEDERQRFACFDCWGGCR